MLCAFRTFASDVYAAICAALDVLFVLLLLVLGGWMAYTVACVMIAVAIKLLAVAAVGCAVVAMVGLAVAAVEFASGYDRLDYGSRRMSFQL
jgi:uncharacterized membrane protein